MGYICVQKTLCYHICIFPIDSTCIMLKASTHMLKTEQENAGWMMTISYIFLDDTGKMQPYTMK